MSWCLRSVAVIALSLSLFVAENASAFPAGSYYGNYVGDKGGGRSQPPLKIALKFTKSGSKFAVVGLVYTSKGSSRITGTYNPRNNHMSAVLVNKIGQRSKVTGYWAYNSNPKYFIVIALNKYVFYLKLKKRKPKPSNPTSGSEHKYYVFLVRNASNSLYIATYAYIWEWKKTRCNFAGGGDYCSPTNPNDKPDLKELLGPYNELGQAQLALCDNISQVKVRSYGAGMYGRWNETDNWYAILDLDTINSMKKYCSEKLPY